MYLFTGTLARALNHDDGVAAEVFMVALRELLTGHNFMVEQAEVSRTTVNDGVEPSALGVWFHPSVIFGQCGLTLSAQQKARALLRDVGILTETVDEFTDRVYFKVDTKRENQIAGWRISIRYPDLHKLEVVQ